MAGCAWGAWEWDGGGDFYLDEAAGLGAPSFEHAVEFLPVAWYAPFFVLPLDVYWVHGGDVDHFAVLDG